MDLIKRAIAFEPAPPRAPTCEHTPDTIAAPSGAACEECGSTWSLRMCATCGHVGCCESQAGHARAHAFAEDHPVIIALPVEHGFRWCYPERRYL